MDQKVLVAALRHVLGFASKDLSRFEELASSHYEWLEDTESQVIEYLSEDEDWNTINKKERLERIDEGINHERYEGDHNSTMTYFKDPETFPKDSWIVHRTKQDPRTIVNNLKGCGPDNLSLTVFTGCEEGGLLFGFGLDHTDPMKEYRNYGKDGILFQAGEAVSVYHDTDKKQQVVFDKDTVTKAYPYIDKDGYLTFFTTDGDPVKKLKKNRETFKAFTKKYA